MTSALVRTEGGALAPFYENETLNQLNELAEVYAQAGAVDQPAQAMAIMLQGAAMGLQPPQAMSRLYAITSGGKTRVGMWSSEMVADIRRAGVKMRLTHDPTHAKAEDKTFAEWTVWLDGDEVTATYTQKEAQDAGLWSRWSGKGSIIPEQMLIWRAASRLIERELSHLVGAPPAESLQDAPEPERIEPARVEAVPTPDTTQARADIAAELRRETATPAPTAEATQEWVEAKAPEPPPEAEPAGAEVDTKTLDDVEADAKMPASEWEVAFDEARLAVSAAEKEAKLEEGLVWEHAEGGLGLVEVADAQPRIVAAQVKLLKAVKQRAKLVAQLVAVEADCRELGADDTTSIENPWRSTGAQLKAAVGELTQRVRVASAAPKEAKA